MTRPALHLVSLPHAQTVTENVTCAFTQKNIRFCEMLGRRDWRITLYSGDRNDATDCDHIALYSSEEQHAWYGDIDPNTLPTKAGIWDADLLPWQITNVRAVAEIAKRADPHDLILLTGGEAQKPIADSLPHMLCVEHAAGYEGIFSPHVCFESHAWRHYLYGRLGLQDGRWFDTVIPNFFRPDDFQIAASKADYLLYVGRIVERKGVRVAAEIAQACGRRLLLAGSGVREAQPGRIVCDELTLEGDHLEYVGVLGDAARNELMGRAAAVLVPTTYIEPFGAVAVEAQLCGTAAVTTDWGAFSETVDPAFRFRTLAEGVAAVERAGQADPAALRARALGRWSLDAVAPLYERWLNELSTLWGAGWYEVGDTCAVTKEAA